MKNHQKFWDRIAKSYAKQPIADQNAYQHKLDTIREHLTPESEVFEFGCGTGSTALALSGAVRSIVATDLSQKMLDIAEERQAEAGASNVKFQRLDIESSAIEGNEYDVVLGMSIIHLLENREQVFQRVADSLKPGGVFFSSTVCTGTSNVFLRFILPLAKPFGLLPNVQFIDEAQLCSELEATGFSIEYRYRPRPDAAVFLMARKGE